MPATAHRPRRAKPLRTLHYNARCGVLFIHVHRPGEGEVAYYLDAIPSEMGGRGFALTKIRDRATVYHVHVSPDGKADSCECKGFLRHHHCKHVDACRDRINAGQL